MTIEIRVCGEDWRAEDGAEYPCFRRPDHDGPCGPPEPADADYYDRAVMDADAPPQDKSPTFGLDTWDF